MKRTKIELCDEEMDFRKFIYLVKKRYKMFIVLLLLSLIAAYILTTIIKPVYKGSFVISVPGSSVFENILTSKEVVKIIDDLDILINEERWKELSEKLHSDEVVVKDIVSLDVKTARIRPFWYEIFIEIHNPAIIKNVANKLISYISEKQGIAHKIKQLRILEKDIDSKIKETEALKTFLKNNVESRRYGYTSIYPEQLNLMIVELKLRKLEIDDILSGILDLGIEKDHVISMKPERPKKLFYLFISLIIAVFIGLLISLLLEQFASKSSPK